EGLCSGDGREVGAGIRPAAPVSGLVADAVATFSAPVVLVGATVTVAPAGALAPPKRKPASSRMPARHRELIQFKMAPACLPLATP
ncbi:MAG: hypothetical protein R3248_15095, partial [Candidatus Promineifilaceae bacterium]|nr:hypothetical protein [Candidatus Promineifilaceae bacterium]